MKSKNQMMLLLATATLFAACGGSDDEAVIPAPQPQQPRMLTVEVGERPMQTESGAKAPRRAGDATTTETLNTFTMCVDKKDWYATLTKTDGKWTTSWPGGNDSKKWNFYAYNVGSENEFVWNGGDPYVSFTMDEKANFQKDFLVAKTAEEKSYNETNGKISLTFDHACAAVQFYVYKEESATYVVKDIQLQNVYKQGDYHFNNNTWSDLSTPANFTLTTGEITPSDTKTLLPKEWLYVIPQSKEGMKLQIKYTKDGGTETTKLIDLSGSWAAGNQYTVNIKIGK